MGSIAWAWVPHGQGVPWEVPTAAHGLRPAGAAAGAAAANTTANVLGAGGVLDTQVAAVASSGLGHGSQGCVPSYHKGPVFGHGLLPSPYLPSAAFFSPSFLKFSGLLEILPCNKPAMPIPRQAHQARPHACSARRHQLCATRSHGMRCGSLRL